MGSFTGVCNLKKDISNEKECIKKMNLKLKKKNTNEEIYFFGKNLNLGCIVENTNGLTKIKFNDITYTIFLNGKIYNKTEIKRDLQNLGHEFNYNTDEEVLLKGFIEYGEDILKKVNGVFSFVIWNDRKQELFIARDHFGIKPIFFTMANEELIFATEIKAILEHPNVETKLDSMGLSELFGLRPMPYTRVYSF